MHGRAKDTPREVVHSHEYIAMQTLFGHGPARGTYWWSAGHGTLYTLKASLAVVDGHNQ